MKGSTLYALMLVTLIGCFSTGSLPVRAAPQAANTNALAAASCSFTVWAPGNNYPLGTVVKYNANGNFYKLVNVGTNGSDGTDPTISTWYWQPTQCDATPPSTCSYTVWSAGVNYPLGTIVKYNANGNFYKLVNVGTNGSDGTDPTISTWYWQPTQCSGGGGSPGGGSFVVSEALFNQMFPNRNAFYTYSGLVSALSAFPAFATESDPNVARQEAAAFLANASHETSGLVYIREVNQANWNSYCQPVGSCGSYQYYGRGPLQLSWNYNYSSAGLALGIDLLHNPDLVATDASVAWKTALWYWMTQSGQTALTPHQAISGGQGFGATIRAINGGIECNATGVGHDEMQDRVNLYIRYTGLLGVSTGNGAIGC